MNITEMLMTGKVEEASKTKTGTFLSRNLARISGVETPVPVEIKSLSPRNLQRIRAMMVDKNGDVNIGKMLDGNLLLIVDGVTNPDLKNKELRNKFGCATPKDLAEKLFDNEIDSLANKINDLSSFKEDEEDDEEMVKN